MDNIKIRNFKGVSQLDISLEGQGVLLKGKNGVGKTTVLDAITWCLYGKNLSRETFDPRPASADRDTETSVELLVSDITFTRVLKEKWVKKRNSLEEEYQGTDTTYFINYLPVKASEFKVMAPEEQLYYTTSVVGYFQYQLHWKDRRDLLLKLATPITEEQLLTINEDFKHVFNLTKAEYEAAKRRANQLKKEIEIKPKLIIEAERNIKDVAGDEDILKAKIKKANDKIVELKQQVREISMSANNLANDIHSETTKKIAEITKSTTPNNNEVYHKALVEESRYKDQVEDLKTQLKNALSNTKCPTCGRELPADEIKTLVGEIDSRLIKAKGMHEIAFKHLLHQKKVMDEQKEKQSQLSKRINEVRSWEAQEVMKIEATARENAKTIEDVIQNEQDYIQLLESYILSFDSNRAAVMRVQHLQNELSEYTKQWEVLTRQVILYEELTQARVELVETEISSKFKVAQFKLFNTTVAGDLTEVCEVLYKDNTTYSTGEGMLLGIDICDTLSRYLNVDTEMLIDGVQSLTYNIKTNKQTIAAKTTDTQFEVEVL